MTGPLMHPPPLESPYPWRQPAPEFILIDDTHALMARVTFEELPEYSATIPTGVYPGKMWRRHDGELEHAQGRRKEPPIWLLCWYSRIPDKPDLCASNYRRVLLV